VGTTNVTVRFNEEELRKLDELAQRMGVTRSDVIRSLINNFDEVLKQEVDREGRRWFALGFVSALESAILDPEVVLRFVRRNVDILGYPDFLIGMVKVRNRVVAFSHHDKLGHQLLSQVRSRIEEDVRKEEEEIEREGDEDEGRGGVRTAPAYVHIRAGVHPRTPRAIPVAAKYKLISNNKGAPPTVKPTATSTVGRVTTNNGGGAAKAAVAASVPKNQKSGSTGVSTSAAPADSQPKDSGPQASASGGSMDPVPAGDFIMALITHSYHKHRNKLLNLVEVLGGDPNAMAH
jgi:hypothetical protein